MSFRGRGGGFRRGSSGGRGRGGGSGGGGRGGFNRQQDFGPPEEVIPLGYFTHSSQDDLVVKAELEDVPFFNAPIYLKNKEQIGKIDEIFGTMKDYYVSVKLSNEVKCSGFKANDKLYIDPAKLLPLKRFLPKPPVSPLVKKQKGQGGGAGQGGRGGGRGRGRGGGFGGRGGGGFRGGGGGGGDRRSFGVGSARRNFGAGGDRRNFGGGNDRRNFGGGNDRRSFAGGGGGGGGGWRS